MTAAEKHAEARRVYMEYMGYAQETVDLRKDCAARVRAAMYGAAEPKRRMYKVETFRSSDTYAVDAMISRFYERMSGREGFRVVNVSYEVVVFDTVAHVHYEVME